MYGKAGGKEHVARRVLGALLSDFPEETRKAIDDDRWAPARAGKEMKRRKLLDLIDDESVEKAIRRELSEEFPGTRFRVEAKSTLLNSNGSYSPARDYNLLS